MWGICLDHSACDGMIFQRVVEYESIEETEAEVILLQPVAGLKVNVEHIQPVDNPPRFVYGELVSVIGNTDVIGKIGDIIWHFKDGAYNYYISVGATKKNTRFSEEELEKVRVE